MIRVKTKKKLMLTWNKEKNLLHIDTSRNPITASHVKPSLFLLFPLVPFYHPFRNHSVINAIPVTRCPILDVSSTADASYTHSLLSLKWQQIRTKLPRLYVFSFYYCLAQWSNYRIYIIHIYFKIESFPIFHIRIRLIFWCGRFLKKKSFIVK